MAETPQDGDAFFHDKKALMVSEVAVLLDEHVLKQKAKDLDYQPNQLLAKTLEYTQRFATNRNKETLKRMRMCLAELGVSEQELAMVCNLQIQTAEEATKLVPSLSRYSDEQLDKVLTEVQTYREFE